MSVGFIFKSGGLFEYGRLLEYIQYIVADPTPVDMIAKLYMRAIALGTHNVYSGNHDDTSASCVVWEEKIHTFMVQNFYMFMVEKLTN